MGSSYADSLLFTAPHNEVDDSQVPIATPCHAAQEYNTAINRQVSSVASIDKILIWFLLSIHNFIKRILWADNFEAFEVKVCGIPPNGRVREFEC